MLGWTVSVAAASALPGSPLYALKRTQESVALAIAPSDQTRGDVLLTIAENRLNEARSAAESGHTSEAKSLVAEFDGTMQQAIALAARMRAHHEPTSKFLSGIDATLNEVSLLIDSSGSSAMAEFSRSLTFAHLHETNAMSSQHLPVMARPSQKPNQQTVHGTPTPGKARQTGGGTSNSATAGRHTPQGTPSR